MHVIPNKYHKSANLFDLVKHIIIGSEEIDFQSLLLSIITDNNAINKKAMSFFCSSPKLCIVYPHPVMKSWPLIFLIDSVHKLKSIRNNWIDQKDANKRMLFPKFCHNGTHELDRIQNAPFCTLQKLRNLEFHQFGNIVINWPQRHFLLLILKGKMLIQFCKFLMNTLFRKREMFA